MESLTKISLGVVVILIVTLLLTSVENLNFIKSKDKNQEKQIIRPENRELKSLICSVVFTSDFHKVGIGEQEQELYCLEKDRTNLTRLTNNTYFESQIDVSPKRNELVSVTLFEPGTDPEGIRDSNAELVIWHINGSLVKRLTNNNRAESSPSWSPDGETIVFYAGDKPGNLNIYTIKRDGTDEKKLTSSGYDKDPSFSPYGEIIFVRDKKIMIMDQNGKNLKMLIDLENRTNTPNNPVFINENTILFDSQTKPGLENYGIGDYDIYLVDRNGQNLKDLSKGNAADRNPCFHAYENKIFFTRVEQDVPGTKLFMMDINGNNKVSLIKQVSNSKTPTANW